MLALFVAIFSAILLPRIAAAVDPDLPMVNKLGGDRLPTSVRLFQPIEVRGSFLQKSAESLSDDQCGGATIVHRDIAMCNRSLPEVYVIPHAAIRHNGEDCGTGRSDEYTILIAGEKLLTAQLAASHNVMAIYEVLSSNARADNALKVLNDFDPVYVGVEMNRPRICGGRERFPRYTIYFFINVSAGSRDLNFRFAYLQAQELGLVTIKPDEQLCLLKESRNLGPGQSPFATPTPSTSPRGEEIPLPETLYNLDNIDDLPACFPVHRLDSSGSPRPQPSPVIGPTPNMTIAASPSMNGTVTPRPTSSSATVTPSAIPSPSSSTGSTPSRSRTPTPTPTDSSNDNVCFPSSATVTLESGDTKRMADLRVGDKVLVSNGKYSEVFMFTHHTTRIRSTFVRIRAMSGESVALSPSHYLPISGQLKAARVVVPGDKVTLANGNKEVVESVHREELWGLHNPQTIEGTIVVNGILASTFTETILPSAAVALLVPIKFLYALGIQSGLFTDAFAYGKPSWVTMLPVGSALW